MEAVSSFETSVNLYRKCYTLHSQWRENLKSNVGHQFLSAGIFTLDLQFSQHEQ
jgi:hypothetical protein